MKETNFMVYVVVFSVFALGTWGSAAAETFDVNVGWIYYQDSSGREIDYNFSDATLDEYGTVIIPEHAVNAPPSESGTTFLWESLFGSGPGSQEVSLVNGVYHMFIPQASDSVKEIPVASINVDGLIEDWNDVSTYIEDRVPEDRWGPTSADVNYVKLAYNQDYSKLYILIKLEATAETSTRYRLFLDKDLDLEVDEPGDYQIDIQYTGSYWDLISQGWNSPNGSDGYPVNENGIVSVSGNCIEISVDSMAFDLPENVNVYGRTVENTDPNTVYDRFSSDFLETDGFSALGAYNAAAPFPTEWQFSTRISGFRNPGFGNNSPYLHWYGISVGVGSSESGDLEPVIEASWVTGHYMEADYNNALVIQANVGNDIDSTGAYEWSWIIDDGNGIVIEDIDPNTAILDLKVDVTNAGQSVSFYYRLNSDEASDWQLAVTHALPVGVGTMYGFYDVFPMVDMYSGFWLNACDFNKDGLVNFSDFSIFGLSWFSARGEGQWNYVCDVSEIKNDAIDYLDLVIFAENWLWGK